MSATIAMLAGLGKGYLDGSKERRDEERQARKDALEKELHDARMDEIRKDKADREALANTLNGDETVKSVSVDVAAKAAPPVASVPVREQSRVVATALPSADGGESASLPSSFASPASAPSAAQAAPKSIDLSAFPEVPPSAIASAGVGSPVIHKATSAQQVSGSDRRERVRQLALQGNPYAVNAMKNMGLFEDEDDRRRAAVVKAKEEGTMFVLMGAHMGVPTSELVERFEANGKTKFGRNEDGTPKLAITPYEVAGDDGKPVKKFKITGELDDGRAFNVADAEASSRAMYRAMVGYKLLDQEAKDKKAEARLDGQDSLKRDELEERKNHNAGMRSYYNKSLEVREAGAATKAESRVPEHVKLQYGELSKQINDIDGDLRRVKLSPDFNPESPAVKAYQAQVHALKMRQSDLMRPYGDQSDPGDEFGFRNGKFTNPPTTEQLQAALSRQAANEAGSPGGGVVPAAKPGVPTVQEQAAIDAKRVAEARSKASAPTPAAIAAGKGSFNEAGYSSVQGTIDGAKRGDKVALQLLQKMIDRGETNQRQRQEIAEIQKAK